MRRELHPRLKIRGSFLIKALASTANHPACTDLAVREIVANWHLLTPSVKGAIIVLLWGS
jgi:hypothetical protein